MNFLLKDGTLFDKCGAAIFLLKIMIVLDQNKYPLLSVIIPVYGTEKYLVECIESVISQTYMNLEIVCVNDCSPDNSQKIINAYCQKDGRVRSIEHEKNLGLGGARNTGIREARGKYITFVDSDDWIKKDCYEKIISLMQLHRADLGIFSAIKFDDKTKKEWTDDYFDIEITTPSQISAANVNAVSATAWNKIYLTEEIRSNEIYFPEHLKHEDEEFWFKYAAKIKPLAVADASKYYQYRQRVDSIMANGSLSRKDMPLIFINIYRFLEEFGLVKEYKLSLLHLTSWSGHWYMELAEQYKEQYLMDMRRFFDLCKASPRDLIKINPRLEIFCKNLSFFGKCELNFMMLKSKIKRVIVVLAKKTRTYRLLRGVYRFFKRSA